MLHFTPTPPAHDRVGGSLSCEIDAVSLENVEKLQKRGYLALMGMRAQRKGDIQDLPCDIPVEFGRIFESKMFRESAKD